MLTLYQAEWCPHSHRVRQALTERGVDFVAKQVPAEPEDREEMRRETGDDSIPLLVLEDGRPIQGAKEILRYVHEQFPKRPDAAKHREKLHAEAEDRAPSKIDDDSP